MYILAVKKMVVEAAKLGFEKYNDAHRILDYVRTQLGDNPRWVDFISYVDKFLGDIFRDQFERAVSENKIGTGALSTFGVIQNNDEIDQINKVAYNFEFLPKDNNKGKGGKGKGKGKKINNYNNNDSGKNSKQQPKTKQVVSGDKKNTKVCAWCQSKDHPTYLCKSYGDGKWADKECNRCKGTGHPQEACVNPPKSKKSK